MKGSEGLYGDAIQSMALRAKLDVKVGILMMGFYMRPFAGAFNAVVENKGYFMKKWEAQVDGEDVLMKVMSKGLLLHFKRQGQLRCLTVSCTLN